MDANPYAPPAAVVADPEPTGLKRRSVLLMIVLMILTFGLYLSIWFLRRRKALNQLDSPRKLAWWPFLAFAVVIGLAVALNRHGRRWRSDGDSTRCRRHSLAGTPGSRNRDADSVFQDEGHPRRSSCRA